MQQNNDVKHWIECWNAWKETDTGLQAVGSAEIWNKRWKKISGSPGTTHKNGRRRANYADEIFELLQEAGFQAKGARVLDIGCGPGALSLPLARAGAKVTSLDFSSTALGRVRSEAEQESLSIETVESSWWTADIDDLGFRNRFDLVIGSMTPAIKDVRTFDLMMDCSRRYCYYSGSVPGGRSKDHKVIHEKILKRNGPYKPEFRPWFFYHFMYVYLGGYRPMVRIHKMNHTMKTDWETVADHAVAAFERNGNLTESEKRKIRTYFRDSAVNGKCSSRGGGYIGMMVWNVNP